MGESDSSDALSIIRQLRELPELFQRIATSPRSGLQLQQELRRDHRADIVRAALSLTEARHRAQGKFVHADRMWFDRTSLEQSTSEIVARHKASRFSGLVLDLCAGIGGDAIAQAAHCDVIAVDRSPVACRYLELNAAVYGVEQRMDVRCDDVRSVSTDAQLVHIDPDRRPGGRPRSVRLEHIEPDLEFLFGLPESYAGGAIKLSPASNFGGKFPNCEVELISVDGECREATVWFGSLAGTHLFRATVLPANATLAGHPLDVWTTPHPAGRYIYDPDPAVVRAGLVDVLCETASLERLDEQEEYLTSAELVSTPFARAFEIVAVLPHTDREIRKYFRTANVGQLEVKCRHIPINADRIRQRVSLEGTDSVTLIIARVEGRARAIVCRRIPRRAADENRLV